MVMKRKVKEAQTYGLNVKTSLIPEKNPLWSSFLTSTIPTALNINKKSQKGGKELIARHLYQKLYRAFHVGGQKRI